MGGITNLNNRLERYVNGKHVRKNTAYQLSLQFFKSTQVESFLHNTNCASSITK
jgi:hypothetical protein